MTWREVSIAVRPSHVESVTAIVLRYAPGGFAEESGGRRRRRVLRLYLAAGSSGLAICRRLWRDLRRVAPEARLTSRIVSDARWHRAWRAHARPLTVGRITILPTQWRQMAPPDAVTIRLDAGMAFGSGEHPTTQLCLRAIERYLRVGDTFIDVGTGSGILAMAAAKLGAARALAIDDDPVAVAVARANVRANGVGRQVAVRLGRGLHRVRLRADLVVANLTAATLPGVLREAARCLVPGGRFVGSGFGAVALPAVVRAVSSAGLRVTHVTALRGWRAVHAVAPGPPHARTGAPRRRSG